MLVLRVVEATYYFLLARGGVVGISQERLQYVRTIYVRVTYFPTVQKKKLSEAVGRSAATNAVTS